MTQQPTKEESERIVKDAANAIKSGQVLAVDDDLFGGAAHAVKLAVDEEDRTFLEFVILAQAGDYPTAMAMLTQMAMNSPGAQQQSAAAPAPAANPLTAAFNRPRQQSAPADPANGQTTTQPKVADPNAGQPAAAATPKRRNR